MAQHVEVSLLRNFDRAQRGQVRRGELAIKQFRARSPQGRHQPGQRHLGRVVHPAEHAFAAEHAGEAHAIEPANQPSVRPGLDRMGVSDRVQLAVAFADAPADPAFLRIRARRGAGVDHRIERGVARHREAPAPQRARQRARQVEPVERQDRPHAWLHPEHLGIVATVRHRENSRAIGLEQQLGRDDRFIGRRHLRRNVFESVALAPSTH